MGSIPPARRADLPAGAGGDSLAGPAGDTLWSQTSVSESTGGDSPPHGVVAVIRREDRYLLVRRGPAVRAGGWWCFPGGNLDPGETEAAALRRELAEELGIAVDPVRRLVRAVTAWGVDLSWWEAAWEPRPGNESLRPDGAEVVEAGWFTREEALALDRLLGSNVAYLRTAEGAQPAAATPR